MLFLHVDDGKCVQCGQCAKVCVAHAIAVDGTGATQVGDYCIACGHCMAVCPTGAVVNTRCPVHEDTVFDESKYPDKESVEMLLQGRRSVRCYQNTPVPRHRIEKLLDIARFAPSGGNSQGIGYVAIDDRNVLRSLTQAIMVWMQEVMGSGQPYPRFMDIFAARYEQEKRDVVLWNAPCLILAYPQKQVPNARENALFAFLYAQLYAPSLGLGTCWAGAVEMAVAAKVDAVMEILRPYGQHPFVAALMVGIPQYQYPRMVGREPLHLSWG